MSDLSHGATTAGRWRAVGAYCAQTRAATVGSTHYKLEPDSPYCVTWRMRMAFSLWLADAPGGMTTNSCDSPSCASVDWQ